MKELEEAIDFVFDIADAVIDSIENDGKITIGDAPNFLKAAMNAPKGIGGINQIPAEIASLSPADSKRLYDKIAQRFDIEDDKLEGYVENALYSAMQLTINIAGIYKLKKAV